MNDTNLNRKIDEMKEEILDGIRRSVQIDSVAGEPEEEMRRMVRAPKKRWTLRWSLGKAWDSG